MRRDVAPHVSYLSRERTTRSRVLLSLLLCQEIDGVGVWSGVGGGLEEVPDAAGEVAFEAADGFFGGLAFGAFAGDVGRVSGWQRARVTATRWMAVLIWRLPPRSRRWRLVLPELTGIGAMPAARASLASLEKRCAPAISPISLPAVSGPKPGSASSCGATWATRSAISASSALMVWESSRRWRSSSRAIRTRAVCSARARRRAIRGRPLS